MTSLYRVTCVGMTASHGVAYVVARDAAAAYRRVRDDLDARDLGFHKERALDRVELLAEDAPYPGCGRRLYA